MSCRRHLLTLLCIFLYTCTYAGLQPIFLNMKLVAAKDTYRTGETIMFHVTFSNTARKSRAILLPGDKRSGNKIIYLSVFKVEDHSYRELARESRTISMKTIPEPSSGNLIKNLQAGQSTMIPVFVNDTANDQRHIEAHHQWPQLPPGRYEVLAWYHPWDDTLSSYIFNKKSSFEKGKQQADTNKLTLPEEGLCSNYATIIIAAGDATEKVPEPTAYCPGNCRLCQAIEKEEWKTIEKIIDRQTFYNGKEDHVATDSSWRMPHRNIAWLSDGPDAILASLPTYTYRNFIFRNSKGYHYFTARWQLGVIYTNRARFQSLLHLLRLGTHISTSDVEYCKLISFKPY